MPSRSKVLGDETVSGRKALGMSGRFALLHALFPLTDWLMRVFHAVVEIAMLTIFDARQDLSLRRAIAFAFVRANHPRDVS